jgi:hypothetical protein
MLRLADNSDSRRETRDAWLTPHGRYHAVPTPEWLTVLRHAKVDLLAHGGHALELPY